MKTYISEYPFAVSAETKVSKGGKEYTAISVKHSSKDVNGKKVSTFFNLFDERDLLILGNLCNRSYSRIVDEKTLERFGDKNNKENEATEEDFKDDDIDDVAF